LKKMEEEDPEEVAQRRGNILRAWAQLGRPGAAKVVQYMRKQGTPVSEKQVLAVLNEQTSQQVFRAPWKSEGFITASEKGDVWQIDIADNSHRSASANNGYKYFYVIVDVCYQGSRGCTGPRKDAPDERGSHVRCGATAWRLAKDLGDGRRRRVQGALR